METKYDKLEKLKQLLDTGELPREEFDAAKRRILDSSEMTSVNQDKQEVENKLRVPKPNKKTIAVIVGVAILTFVMALSTGCSGRSSQSGDAWSSDTTAIEYSTSIDDIINGAIETGSDEDYEFNNPWRVNRFHDDYGEDTDLRYLTTYLQGSGWNLEMDFIPPHGQASEGVMRFAIVDGEGYIQDMYGPAYIVVRTPDGESYQMPVEGVKGAMAFVESPTDVAAMKMLLNQGHFDIIMEFEKYNERHRCSATFDSTPGFFNRAINEIL